MKRKMLVAAAMFAVSTASHAWGWGPWGNNGWGDGLMDGDFGFSMHASGRGHGRGYGDYWDHPYYGYGPYGYAPYGYGHGPYAAPYAPFAVNPEQMREQADAQRDAALEYHKQMQEQQRTAMEERRKAFDRQLAMMRGTTPASEKSDSK